VTMPETTMTTTRIANLIATSFIGQQFSPVAQMPSVRRINGAAPLIACRDPRDTRR